MFLVDSSHFHCSFARAASSAASIPSAWRVIAPAAPRLLRRSKCWLCIVGRTVVSVRADRMLVATLAAV